MTLHEKNVLHQEARYLNFCIFSRHPNHYIINIYLDAHREITELLTACLPMRNRPKYFEGHLDRQLWDRSGVRK